jgi:hypothetical protein
LAGKQEILVGIGVPRVPYLPRPVARQRIRPGHGADACVAVHVQREARWLVHECLPPWRQPRLQPTRLINAMPRREQRNIDSQLIGPAAGGIIS